MRVPYNLQQLLQGMVIMEWRRDRECARTSMYPLPGQASEIEKADPGEVF